MNWIQALVAWNKKHGGKYTIPRKGTKEHAEVLAMMGPKTHKETPKEHHRRSRSESPKARKPKAKKSDEYFIQEVVKTMKKGAMTKTAKRHGETPLEYAKEVLAHPEEHTLTMRRRAQFLVNIQKKKD